jgi:hypothetical protein
MNIEKSFADFIALRLTAINSQTISINNRSPHIFSEALHGALNLPKSFASML